MSADQSTEPIRNKALDLLARREHSAVELCRKLAYRGFNEDEVEQVVTELSERGLQSDLRFTESYVRSRINRGFGRRKIIAELQQRGIASELIEQFVRDQPWEALARTQLTRKFGTTEANDLQQLTQMKRFLEQKGFTSEWLRM